MAESLQPRSALTPPRSPAPINATRPDFPVRAGQFLGHASPARTGLRRSLNPVVAKAALPAAEADYDMGGDSVRNPAQRIAVSSQSLLARAPDTIPHREPRSDTAPPCRNCNPRMHSRRSRRNGATWQIAAARIFLSYTAAGGGGAITAKSGSSCVCTRPFG
jgi:hypothetical protein